MVDCARGHTPYGDGMIRALSSLLLLCSAMLVGCSEGVDNERVRIDVIEDRPRPFNVSATPLPLASAYLRAATAQGLSRSTKRDALRRALPIAGSLLMMV